MPSAAMHCRSTVAPRALPWASSAAALLLATICCISARAQSPAIRPITAEELQLFGYEPTDRSSDPPDMLRPQVDGAAATHQLVDPGADHGLPIPCGDCWSWQIVPDGVLFPAYLAGVKESRIGTQPVYVRDHGWFWDCTLGGRAGLLRYGSENPCWPEGWQLDVEGAAFPRLDPEAKWELRSSDFRFGIPLTYRRGRWEGKFGYYHLCAHLGDFFVLEHLAYPRISYVRDAAVAAMGFRPCPDLRLYYEAAFAFHTDGEARPWEFQFGAEYSPVGPTGARGAPFVAVNTHLRQDNDFSGNVSLQTGWQWRGRSTHLMRVGLHYFNGLSEQYQFYANHEDQVGAGLWYDF